MIIQRHRPVTRGIDRLQYISGTAELEAAIAAVTPKEVGLGAVAAFVALKSKGIVRIAAAGAAAYVAWQLWQAYQTQMANTAAAAAPPVTSSSAPPAVTTTVTTTTTTPSATGGW